MAITYSLAPNPKWYISDLVGRPLGGGYLATFSSQDHTLLKPVFQDAGGIFPWPYVTVPNVGVLGILFDENGAQGPFYFEFDSALPDELYYLEVYDSDGVLQWTIDDFNPNTGGGGGVITEALDLENLVVNNVFWRNVGDTANPIAATFLKLAPSANTGLVQTTSNAGPDICFIKNNTTATDQIQFVPFTLGSTPFTGDVTPVEYLNYECTNTPAGETQKMVQFPITKGVQNLTNQNVTVTIWARGTAGTTTLTLSFFQFFGNGSTASPSVITPIQTINLTSSWQKFTMQATVPDVTGKNLGGCRNDGLFLQVNYPLGVSCNIGFTKLCMYLGNVVPEEQYETYDMINAVIDSPRTGDLRQGLNAFSPYGWVPCNDGTIGNPSSNASTRANFDTFPLFDFVWSISSVYAPMYSSAGVPTVRGASAIDDFTANNRISLPDVLGRVIAGTTNGSSSQQTYTVNVGVSTTNLTVADSTLYSPGTPIVLLNSGGAPPTGLSLSTTYYPIIVSATVIQLTLVAYSGVPVAFSTNGTGTNSVVKSVQALGSATGELTHTLSIAEMPSHNHQSPITGGSLGSAGNGPFFLNVSDPSGVFTPPIPSEGGGQAHPIVQPTVFMNMFLKL